MQSRNEWFHSRVDDVVNSRLNVSQLEMDLITEYLDLQSKAIDIKHRIIDTFMEGQDEMSNM